MTHLDIKQLPRELRKVLDRHFDNDESKRRAVLAPWCAARCSSIWRRGTWAWDPLRGRLWSLLDRGWAKDFRVSREEFFALRLNPFDPTSQSIFDPDLPFFPTPLTNVTKPMVSPWPDVLSDAEYWAFVMQLHSGDEAWGRNRLEGWVPELRETVRPRGLERLRFWHTKSGVLANMHYLMSSQNVGDYL